jgi:hypothetical protein
MQPVRNVVVFAGREECGRNLRLVSLQNTNGSLHFIHTVHTVRTLRSILYHTHRCIKISHLKVYPTNALLRVLNLLENLRLSSAVHCTQAFRCTATANTAVALTVVLLAMFAFTLVPARTFKARVTRGQGSSVVSQGLRQVSESNFANTRHLVVALRHCQRRNAIATLLGVVQFAQGIVKGRVIVLTQKRTPSASIANVGEIDGTNGVFLLLYLHDTTIDLQCLLVLSHCHVLLRFSSHFCYFCACPIVVMSALWITIVQKRGKLHYTKHVFERATRRNAASVVRSHS